MTSEIFEFLGSLHPLLVHLPIGFILLTFLVDIFIKKKNNAVKGVITLGWFFSFLSGAIATLFGWFLGSNNYYFESQIDIHKWSGIAFVGIAFIIWLLRFLNFHFSRFFSRFINLTVLILVLVTSHYGGEMTHGKGYLLKNLPYVKKELNQKILLADKDNPLDSLYVYEDMIYPVLEEKCIACHNQNNTYGGLNMTAYESLIKGGNNGTGIMKGNPYQSAIFKRVNLSQNHPKFMPPSGTPMNYDEVAILHWWIDNGAKRKIPLVKFRNDNSIRKLVEEKYQLDLKEKSYLETLKLSVVPDEKLKLLNEEKFQWRFLTNENSLLDLKFTAKKISVNDLKSLDQIGEHIAWLNLSDCQLTDDMLSHFSKFTNLTRLRIQKNRLTDKGIKFLNDLENINELNLYGTRITDASLEVFSQMKGLKKIFLWNTRVSANGIKSFKSLNPAIEIITGL
tara:strand:- start:1975 stop:3327 length:1353 start_codon:yes stop_codon:yes gene_type:complete